MHQPIPLVARIDNSQSVFYHFSGPLIFFFTKNFLARFCQQIIIVYALLEHMVYVLKFV